MAQKTDLSKYSNNSYDPRGRIKRILWYIMNIIFFKSSIVYPYKFKVTLLRLFGAKIGKDIIIKPNVNIKYPWFLKIGDNVWVGEGVWIDNLGLIEIGNNVCISQGVYLLTGSHNYKKQAFDLMIKPVIIKDGVWLCACSIVTPGITCKNHSVLAVNSVATKDMEPYKIYQGNPAVLKREREIE